MDPLLTDSLAIQENHRLIWSLLGQPGLLELSTLADQPYGSPAGRDGLLVTRQLGIRLRDRSLDAERTIALLTAIGMQPARGVPEALTTELRRVIHGKHVFRRRGLTLRRFPDDR